MTAPINANKNKFVEFILNPSSDDFSKKKKALAWMTTLITGILTFGAVQAGCAIWRKRNVKNLSTETVNPISFPEQIKNVEMSRISTEGATEPHSESSVYRRIGNTIHVTVQRNSLISNSIFHLKQAAAQIRSVTAEGGIAHFKIQYIDDAQKAVDLLDEGAVAREYFDLIAENCTLALPDNFKTTENVRLKSPQASSMIPEGNLSSLLSEDENTLFQDLGAVMMCCYRDQSHHINLGLHFEAAPFNAILALNNEEIGQPFKELSETTKLKMAKAIMIAWRQELGIKIYEEADAFIENLKNFDELTEEELMGIATYLQKLYLLPESWLNEKDVPLRDPIISNKQELRAILSEYLFTSPFANGQLGRKLPALHALAKGMHEIIADPVHRDSAWNELRASTNYDDFSDRIQGACSREALLNSFEEVPGLPEEAAKKLGWLKEWILDRSEETGSSDEEIRLLIKFITGSTALHIGQKIKIMRQYTNFNPSICVNACSCTIMISPVKAEIDEHLNDHSKEAFIKTLREITLINANTFSAT